MGRGWQAKRIVLIAVQWLCLTAGIGALLVRVDAALVSSIGGEVGIGSVGLVALLAGFLLGLSVPEPKALYPLAFLMCVSASLFVMGLVYAPVLAGTIERTTTLDNFALTRGLLYTGLLLAPVGIGAVAGQLLSSTLAKHGELLRPEPDDFDRASWWDQSG